MDVAVHICKSFPWQVFKYFRESHYINYVQQFEVRLEAKIRLEFHLKYILYIYNNLEVYKLFQMYMLRSVPVIFLFFT